MKFVISGFYGLHNTGDEAILQAIVDNLRKAYDNTEITVLSLSPEQTAKTHNVRSFYRGWRRDNWNKVKEIKSADVLISGGGGLLQDTYPTKFLFGPLPYYLLIVLLAKIVGTPVMFFSQGIGPVTSTWGKFLMRRLANKADFVTVRDEFSKQYLHDLRVTKPQTIVTADVVFALETHDPADTIRRELQLTDDDRYIAIAPRPWFEHEETYIQHVAEALDVIVEKHDVIPVFVTMETPSDVLISERIIEKMKFGARAVVFERVYAPVEIAHFIGKAELTIALRLHALIFSALSHVPHIGLSYDPKVEAFLKRSSMWPHSFRLGEETTEALIEQADQLLTNPAPFEEQIERAIVPLKEEAWRNFELLQQNFSSKSK